MTITTLPTLKRYLQTGILLAAATLSVRAGTFNNDFNAGTLPAGTHINGSAVIELTGGVGDSGALKLTKNINSQQGSFILDDLDGGNPIYGFEATFKMRIGGGTATPADGLSLSVGPALTDTSNFGEGGAGGGLIFAWDIYNNPDTPPAPRINVITPGGQVAYRGYTIAGITTSGDVNTWWADVRIRLDADGSLDLDYKGENVFTNFFIPGYQALVDAGLPLRFGLGARTGGLNAHQWIDNLQITTFTQPMVGISQQPFSQTILQGNTAHFDVRVANTNGASYQWFSNNVPIVDAVSPTLTLTNVQPAASGSLYKVTITGPNNAVTSTEVTLTVTNLTVPTPPQLSFDFEGGITPPEALLAGTAFVDFTGGVNDSGTLKLVNPAGSGAIIVTNPFEAGQPVYGFTARFQTLVGGGTVPPADGFAFAFGDDIPDVPSGDFETGVGLGNRLRVTFDIYNNDGIFGYVAQEPQPAPSIDVRYGNQVIATARFPVSFMETGVDPVFGAPLFADTVIQLNTDGTLNVVHHGALVFDRLPIPGFSFITGGRFAIAARTGGLNANIWVDNFQLTSATNSGGEFRITTQPASQTVLINNAATFSVGVNDTNGVTYQWLRNGAIIPGANASTHIHSPALVGNNGDIFAVEVTKSATTLASSNVTLTVVNLTAPVSPNLTFDFNDGLLPAGTALYEAGGAAGYITPNGGVGDSGVLHLTDAVNGQQGAFVINSLYSGAQVSAIEVAFDLLLGGGSEPPADGFSFNFAANLPDAVGGSEAGVGNGLSVQFDIFSPPFIGVRYKGAQVATIPFSVAEFRTGTEFRKVLLRVDEIGKLYLAYGERVIFNGLQLPNYTFTAAGRFGFYGRTGGLNENQWFDNIQIKATQSSGPLAVVDQPDNMTIVAGRTATFNVALSDPNGATYQWQRQSVGGSFTNIPGATTASYTTPAATLADNGALFRVNATGPSGSTTSANALLTVVAPITVSNPTMTYDFNDCLLPPDTITTGPAYVNCFGGIGDSGNLHLTDNVNGQQGSFLMPGFNGNAPVSAITVTMAVRIADGTGTPADGLSFVWGSSNSIPDTVNFGEGGAGDGLVVGLITYAGRADGPSFYVWYRGAQVVSTMVPYSALFTGDLSVDPLQQYATLGIRVNANGTLDLQYKGNAIYIGLPLPNYTPMVGGRFGLGARTGGENETHWIDNIAIATTVASAPVVLGFNQVGNNLQLTWGAGYKLQSTTNLTSPIVWTDVDGATSPYQTPMTGTGRYFRLAATP